jgi:hypothetical protein
VAFELALKNQPGLRRVLKMLSGSVDEISIGTINIAACFPHAVTVEAIETSKGMQQ